MLLQAIRKHNAHGVLRQPGELFDMPEDLARHLVKNSFAIIAPHGRFTWWDRDRRELRLLAVPATPRPVVACLCIWNDRNAFAQTAPSWLPFVDALVIADGAYATVGGRTAASTDGLLDLPWLRTVVEPHLSFDHVTIIPAQRFWLDQCTKRTELLRVASRAYPEGVLFIVDADEAIRGGEALRELPELDVGWVVVRNPMLYQRPYDQPRLVKASPTLRYHGRHHWLYDDTKLLATHQYGGTTVLHRTVPLQLTNYRGLGRDRVRQSIKQQTGTLHYLEERIATTGPAGAASDLQATPREALRILQLGNYDPGGVMYRLHTALNATTPHASLIGTDFGNNPFRFPEQYDLTADATALAQAWDEADIVHFHLEYRGASRIGKRPNHRCQVIHHHGTMYRREPGPDFYNALDSTLAGLRLVSNLELLQYGEDLHYLPNPMPVAEYRRLRETALAARSFPQDRFVIAHSPSKRHLKGTEEFLRVCEGLQAEGLQVHPVLIEGMPHAQALFLKAQCDAVFDSFWLGMQCSGLEGAAMGLPVIAGDAEVAGAYRAWLGEVPYTFASGELALRETIVRLAQDTDWRVAETARLLAYVMTHHDEAAVALHYLNLLDDAFQWRAQLRTGRKPWTHDPAPPMHPHPAQVKHPKPLPVRHPQPEPIRT